MDSHEDHDDKGQHQYVQYVPSEQRFATDLLSALSLAAAGGAGWSASNTQYRDGASIYMANETMGPMVIWYWKDQLAKAGYTTFPKDIEGLIALSKALRDKGLQPMAFGMSSKALFNFDYTFYTLLTNWDPGGEGPAGRQRQVPVDVERVREGRRSVQAAL